MPDQLTFGSLFAGVGGFDLGMEAAGWACGWQVEWDPKCQQVLAHHWPDVPRWGDVCEVPGADLPPVDCITFGSPCQDLSVAGKRAGLDGARSGLFFEAVRIIKEMRNATDHAFPRWCVWENVAGALSSNRGADFGAVLDTLANAGALVLEWAVLDARWFGVPQRRRRVFVVACFDPATADGCPDPLLPVAPRSGWHPPTSDPAGKDVAGTLGGGAGSRGWAPDTDQMTFVPVITRRLAHGTYADGDEVSSQLTATNAGDPTSSDLVIPFVKVVRSGARDANGNLPPEVWREEHTAPTLNAFDNNSDTRATVLAFDSTWSGAYPISAGDDITPPLKVGSGIGLGAPPPVLTPDVGARVRRLTPLECERLMGWPDDHTRWTADGDEIADSHRYRMCGNGVASPVARWVGHHLLRATPGGTR